MKYYECGCCGHYHKENFYGDCRNDSERFTLDDLDEQGVEDIDIIDIEPRFDISSI